jgi:hypothetical protein
MQTWKPAGSVFQGGTQEVLALKGKRVRARRILLGMRVHTGISGSEQSKDVAAGECGFIANPQGSDILIAFPRDPSQRFANIDALTRHFAFDVIVVNWPTFKIQFDVEA